jgi:hypothetical protein
MNTRFTLVPTNACKQRQKCLNRSFEAVTQSLGPGNAEFEKKAIPFGSGRVQRFVVYSELHRGL